MNSSYRVSGLEALIGVKSDIGSLLGETWLCKIIASFHCLTSSFGVIVLSLGRYNPKHKTLKIIFTFMLH
jgi:hypothetical protein